MHVSLQVRQNSQPIPQQIPSSLQPASTSQSGYYNVRHMSFKDYNTNHSHGHSISSSHPNFQSSSSSRNDLHGPQQTFNHQRPGPLTQPEYHSLQQLIQFTNQGSPALHNGQLSYSSSQPNSNLQPMANLQPSQGQFSGSRSQVHYRPSGSSKAHFPNVNVQQMPAVHQHVPTANLIYNGQSSQATFQDYKNQNCRDIATSTSFQSVPSSGVPVESNQNHVSVPVWYQNPTMHQPALQPQQMPTNANQTVQINNINHVQMAAVRNCASHVAQTPTVAQVPMLPYMPPSYQGPHVLINQGQLPHNVNSVQNSSTIQQQASSSRPHNTHASQNQLNHTVPMGNSSQIIPQYFVQKWHRFVQSQLKQNTSQSSSVSSPQQNPPPQGFKDVSQGLQANRTMDVLTGNSQETMSCTSPTQGRSPPVNNSAHGCPSKAARSEAAQISSVQMSSDKVRSGRKMSKKRHREVELCTDPADCLELVVALQKAARQVHRAVAVIPPIFQQADQLKTTEDDCLPLRNDAVLPSEETECKQSETNAPSLPKEICKELLQMQNRIEPVNESRDITGNCEVPLSANPAAAGSPNLDSAQTQNAVSKSQSPNMHQAPISSPALSAKSPEEPNDKNVDSHLDNVVFDFSTVPVSDCTLERLQHFVCWMETMNAEKENELATDVAKRIVDLYWDRDVNNMGKDLRIAVATWAKTIEEFGVHEKQAVVFQYVTPNHLKRLSCHHIMEHDTILPAKKFRSSWLNVDENPPDIDKVLAEPVVDYDFTWCKHSPSMSDGAVMPVDHLVQDLEVSTQNISIEIENALIGVEKISEISSDGTAVSQLESHIQDSQNYFASQVESIKKELSETRSVDLTESPVAGLVLDSENDAVNRGRSTKNESPEITVEIFVQNVLSDLLSSSQIFSSELELNDVIEPGMLNENKQTLTEVPPPASHLSNSVPPIESDGNSYEKENRSRADSASDDLSMDVVLLSTDDATAIFKEQEEPPELCLEEAIFSTSHLGDLFGDVEFRSYKPPKFTCPHVTDIICDGDHFCSKCLDETPMLDVDLDGPLLSPEENGPHVTSSPLKPDNGSCSPHSGIQTEEVIELISPDIIGGISQMSYSSEINSSPLKPDNGSCSSHSGIQTEEGIELMSPDIIDGISQMSYSSGINSSPLKPDNGSCSPHSGIQTEKVIELMSPDTIGGISPTSNSSKIMKGPSKTDNRRQSSSPKSCKQTFQKPRQSVSPEGTKLVTEEACEVKSSAVAKVHSSLGQTKRAEKVKHFQTESVPLPQHEPFKKHKLSKKYSSHKKHSDIYRDKIKKKRKEEKCFLIETSIQTNKQSAQTEPDAHRMAKMVSTKPVMTNYIEAVCPKNQTKQKLEEPESSTRTNSDAKQHRDNICVKQAAKGLSLYGSRSGSSIFMHQCHDREKSSVAPVFIKVSSGTANTNDGRKYTDVPSAKEKIYKQWFSSLVQKQTTLDKRKKHSKNELKKVIEIQKNVMKERTISKSEGDKSVKRDLRNE